MMYINTIYRFGVERFFSLCQETGIDAVIVPDLPFEEHDEIDECAYAHGVYPINLVAPTSKDRIAAIAANSKRIFVLRILYRRYRCQKYIPN